MANAVKPIAESDITDAKSARRLMEVALRFVGSGTTTVDEVAYRSGVFSFNKDFIKAARSALASAKRWCVETLALLPAESAPPEAFTEKHRKKAWASYKQAQSTMKLVQELANDNTSWVDDLAKAARQVLKAVASTAGEIAGGAADAAGGAAGSLLWGLLKGLGAGGVLTVAAVVGVVLVVKKKVPLL